MEDENVGMVDTSDDLSLYGNLANTVRDANKFNIPTWLWEKLESMTDDEWFEITDKVINFIGYKSSSSNPCHNRSNLFGCVRKKFIEHEEYRITHEKIKKLGRGRGGAHVKVILEMTKSVCIKLLQITFELRINSKKAKSHFVYVLHNPMFLHYGPDVYKVGYTQDTNARVKAFSTGYLEPSTMVYYKQVPSKRCELKLHKMMSKYRLSEDREFFDCPLPMIKDFMEQL